MIFVYYYCLLFLSSISYSIWLLLSLRLCLLSLPSAMFLSMLSIKLIPFLPGLNVYGLSRLSSPSTPSLHLPSYPDIKNGLIVVCLHSILCSVFCFAHSFVHIHTIPTPLCCSNYLLLKRFPVMIPRLIYLHLQLFVTCMHTIPTGYIQCFVVSKEIVLVLGLTCAWLAPMQWFTNADMCKDYGCICHSDLYFAALLYMLHTILSFWRLQSFHQIISASSIKE